MAKTKHAKPVSQPSKPASKNSQPVKPASKTSRIAKKPVKKERGTLLSVLIGLVAAHGIFATYLAYITLKEQYRGSMAWVIPVLALASLAAVVAAYGMWRWKKWGLYLYGAVCVVQAVIHLMLTGSGLVAIYDILPFAFLGYVINLQTKQSLFE